MEKTIKDTLQLLELNSISKETAFELIEAVILQEQEFVKNALLKFNIAILFLIKQDQYLHYSLKITMGF